MRRSILLAIALAALLAPAPAAASTLTNSGGVMTFTGAPGATNVVALSDGPNVTIEITGADTIVGQPPNCLPGGDPSREQTCTEVTRVIVNAGGGNDDVRGTNLTGGVIVVLLGGDGNDTLYGGPSADSVEGGAGNDTIVGDSGADTLRGGAGNDGVAGNAGNDTIDGGDDDDVLDGDAGADVLDGGAGIDDLILDDVRPNVDVSLDDAPNDGAPGEGDNVIDVEDVTVSAVSGGAANITGDAGANVLNVDGGNGTITGGDGADLLVGGPANDTIHARDGWPDRVSCGAGSDVALADTLDTVSPSCENAQVAIVHGGADDRPPSVAWTAPAAGTRFRGDVATTLAVDAADDRGIAKVQFFDDDRLICEALAAPFTCVYRARGADVGRNTLIAVAVDGANQTTSAPRPVEVTRFRPSSLSLRVSPRRDRRGPYSFRARGRLRGAGACSGRVRVTAKAGRRTVSSRRARLRSNCTYSTRVRLRSRPARRLRISARFAGNRSTLPRSARGRTVRLG
jgi:hypothetical protein